MRWQGYGKPKAKKWDRMFTDTHQEKGLGKLIMHRPIESREQVEESEELLITEAAKRIG